MKRCPHCKALYSPRHGRCPRCNAELPDEDVQSTPGSAPQSTAPQSAWLKTRRRAVTKRANLDELARHAIDETPPPAVARVDHDRTVEIKPEELDSYRSETLEFDSFITDDSEAVGLADRSYDFDEPPTAEVRYIGVDDEVSLGDEDSFADISQQLERPLPPRPLAPSSDAYAERPEPRMPDEIRRDLDARLAAAQQRVAASNATAEIAEAPVVAARKRPFIAPWGFAALGIGATLTGWLFYAGALTVAAAQWPASFIVAAALAGGSMLAFVGSIGRG